MNNFFVYVGMASNYKGNCPFVSGFLGYVVCNSEYEAIGHAYKQCVDRFKQADGYIAHSVDVLNIPADVFQAICGSETSNEE